MGDAVARPGDGVVGVVNPVRVPNAADGRRRFDAVLAEAEWPAPTWVETTAADPGVGQARSAASDRASVVVAYGGDGTVRACIEGLAGTDTALDVVVIDARSLRQWLTFAWGVLTRTPVARVTCYRCQQVTIRADRDQPRQLDGDVITPGRVLSATVRPGALELVAPIVAPTG